MVLWDPFFSFTRKQGGCSSSYKQQQLCCHPMPQACQLALRQLCTCTSDHTVCRVSPCQVFLSFPWRQVLLMSWQMHKFFTFLLDKISREKRRWD